VADHGEVHRCEKGPSNPGVLYKHTIRRVCTLEPPLHVKALDADPLLPRQAVFSGNYERKLTEHWWRVHELIVRKYPGCAAALKPYSPSRV
jgi:hypothetical protein